VRVIATAGHVDHGKSTLVLTLTGMDPDRFTEEKLRGLTIDLGFAWATMPSGSEVAFVDVPGHVRFIKNMLAGVGAVDACLFVVAATEGWKPQSEEHLRIVELLGLSHGVVAITKVGLVDDDTTELAHLEVAEQVAGTFLEGAEVVHVDALSGRGVDDLKAALDRLIASTPPAADIDRPRLWIDRSFSARGAGTVVTGTLTGGTLAVDDDLVIEPGGLRTRVRSLQSLHRTQERVGPGSRVAVNLGGVNHAEVSRGAALVRPGQWHPTRHFDASLQVLDSLDHDVSRRGAYQAYVGSGEYPVRLRVLGAESLDPGREGPVRLHMATRLPLLPGDRYVLRESGRDETIGGGEVLDVAPVLPASRARPSRSVERVVAERGWIEATELERVTGFRREPDVGRWVVSEPARMAEEQLIRESVTQAGPVGLNLATLSARQRALLGSAGPAPSSRSGPPAPATRSGPLDDIVVLGGRARFGTAEDPLATHPYVASLASSPFSPPEPAGIDRAELRELVRRQLIVERDGCYFAPAAISEAALRIARLLADHPEGVTVAQVRDLFGTTRKHALPLLAELDASGITRRRGDFRFAGPRIPLIS